ncbi:MAG: hydrogenase maturation protease [Terriglobia bacterium]
MKNRPSILIAGIGNIFMGDDGFGVEVAQRLAGRALPEGVRVIDFGIRGFDLAYALLDGQDNVTILIDASPRGRQPGTLYVIDPVLDGVDGPEAQPAVVETHGMNPMNVIGMVKSMGGRLKRILIVGCEPLTLGPEEGVMGLSPPVQAAVNEALNLIESLVARILAENQPVTAG